MSYFEFRQYWESAIPFWAPFVIPIVLLLIVLFEPIIKRLWRK